jgi:hypothetical protein
MNDNNSMDPEKKRAAADKSETSSGNRRRDFLRLLGGVMFRAFGNLPRPESWLPYVITDIDQAFESGCVR